MKDTVGRYTKALMIKLTSPYGLKRMGRLAFTVIIVASPFGCIRESTDDGEDTAANKPDVREECVDQRWTDVEAGIQGTCGITENGHVCCWGQDYYQAGIPLGGDFASVTLGGGSACALDGGRVATCWGLPEQPTSEPVESVAVWGSAVCTAALDDQRVACVGNESSPGGEGALLGTRPSDVLRELDVDRTIGCGLNVDGTAACWGDLFWEEIPSAVPQPASVFIDIQTSADATCGLTEEGAIECWGGVAVSPPADVAFSMFRLGTGGLLCALDDEGGVRCWWPNGASWPMDEPPSGAFIDVAVGSGHVCGIRLGGEIECWGLSAEGEGEPPQ